MTAEDRTRIDAAIDDALTPPNPPARPATGDTGAVSLRLLGVPDVLDLIDAVSADLDAAEGYGDAATPEVSPARPVVVAVVKSLDRLGFVITKRVGSAEARAILDGSTP